MEKDLVNEVAMADSDLQALYPELIRAIMNNKIFVLDLPVVSRNLVLIEPKKAFNNRKKIYDHWNELEPNEPQSIEEIREIISDFVHVIAKDFYTMSRDSFIASPGFLEHIYDYIIRLYLKA